MARKTIRQRLDALNRATTSFRETKKRTISKICSVGVRHRWLKYPSLIAAVFFIFFANAAFYISLWVILNKRLATGIAITLVAAIGLLIVSKDYIGTSGMYRQTADEFTITLNNEETGLIRNINALMSGNTAEDNANGAETAVEEEKEWYELISVDFDRLKAANGDIVGWIFFENEDISYPIL